MSPDLSTGTLVVSLVAMLGWLALNISALRSHNLDRAKTLQYGFAWVAIFGLVAFVASRMAG